MDALSKDERRGVIMRARDWWISRRLSARSELAGLSAADIDSMARDIGISSDDLLCLGKAGPEGGQLMARMMDAVGLDFEELQRSHPDVLKDIEIHCSLCGSKGRCRHNLDEGTAAQRRDAYCPNAATFASLLSEPRKA